MTLFEEIKEGLQSGIDAYSNGTELKKTVADISGAGENNDKNNDKNTKTDKDIVTV